MLLHRSIRPLHPHPFQNFSDVDGGGGGAAAAKILVPILVSAPNPTLVTVTDLAALLFPGLTPPSMPVVLILPNIHAPFLTVLVELARSVDIVRKFRSSLVFTHADLPYSVPQLVIH